MKTIHSQRLERWLGAEKIAKLQRDMRGWYGRPICLLDVPGSVWITKDGDFVGSFRNRGYFMSAVESMAEIVRRARPSYGFAGAGFASIGDALSRASQGYSQRRYFQKAGASGTATGSSNTLWRVGNTPVAGAAGAATPGGTVHASSDTGAFAYANPAAGTLHLIGADVAANTANNTLLLYDRLFSVTKTASSSATEAVSGVPTRYQSTTASNPDYIGDNFGFIEAFTALGAVAHNWTVCLYTDQGGNSSTLPSLAGINGCGIDRLDMPTPSWFVPLESGDVGIKAWTQLQASVNTVTGTALFCIGHPIGFMAFPTANITFPFDWLTNRDQAPRVFDNACLAFLEPCKPSTTACTYTGRVQMTNAAA